jgi:hypothetical protein
VGGQIPAANAIRPLTWRPRPASTPGVSHPLLRRLCPAAGAGRGDARAGGVRPAESARGLVAAVPRCAAAAGAPLLARWRCGRSTRRSGTCTRHSASAMPRAEHAGRRAGPWREIPAGFAPNTPRRPPALRSPIRPPVASRAAGTG